MKFVCDRCGKKYATAEDPAPGKVYKLKCKACGNLIVVKGQAGTTTGLPAIDAAEAATATAAQEPALTPVPAPHPEIELHVEPEPPRSEPDPAPLPGASAAAPSPEPEAISDDAIEPLPPLPSASPLPAGVALAIDEAAATSLPEPLIAAGELAPALPALAIDPALVPPSPDKDELADFAAAAAEVMAAPFGAHPGEEPGKQGTGYVDLFGEITGQRPLAASSTLTDAFSVAARASLPDTYAGTTPTGDKSPPAPPPSKPAAPVGAPMVARAVARKAGLGGTPLAIVGLGLVALIAITAWALLGHGRSPAPPVAAAPRPAPRVEPPFEARPPPPAPVAEPVVEPEKAEQPKSAERRPEPKPRAAERKPERRVEPKAAEKRPEPPAPQPVLAAAPAAVPAAAQEPRTESREPEIPDAATALTQDVVNRVVGANRKAFTNCISNAKESGVALDGRRVALRITVNTNGTVTYPTLDDQSLNATEMGQCLKSAARLMIFPRFKGDPFHYEVPLILSGG